jgi:YVTN family beta-propeller protein
MQARLLDSMRPTGQTIKYADLSVWLLAAVAGKCIWGSRPCDGQIEVDAYISNTNSNSVSVIDTETNTVFGSSLAVGSQPAAVAVTPDGKYAYVTNNGSNTLSIIDTASKTVLGPTIMLQSPVNVGRFGRLLVCIGGHHADLPISPLTKIN